jgi:hypothetical protein
MSIKSHLRKIRNEFFGESCSENPGYLLARFYTSRFQREVE